MKKKIDAIQFALFNQFDVIKASSSEVVSSGLYLPGIAKPVPGSVLDRHLGVCDKNEKCVTCGENVLDCPGHFGHVTLPLPVFHVGYFRHIIAILNQVCKTCSRILLRGETARKWRKIMLRSSGTTRNAYIRTLTNELKKVAKCPHCGAISGLCTKLKGTYKIIHDLKLPQGKRTEFSNHELHPLDVETIFKKIAEDDLPLLAMDPAVGRPENLLLRSIPVPPLCIRPSVQTDWAGSNEDDLTVKVAEMVLHSENIRKGLAKGESIKAIMGNWNMLQGAIAGYITGDVPAALSGTRGRSKPIRGFYQRLKGKHGRFRWNLCGKRVNFSGRTVISPDPNLPVDHVVIPEDCAKVLTFPEVVTHENKAELQELVRAGSDTYPGANTVILKNGEKLSLFKQFRRKSLADRLRCGDIVERHLNGKDVVLFNRQPSLHKLSIMCHRVKVMKWKTFRFNVSVCKPYNADFDGDEMNIHVPQTQEARSEALILMGVLNNIVTPKDGSAVVAPTQDFLTGAYLLTQRNVFFDREDFMQHVAYVCDADAYIELPMPCIVYPKELWSGKQVISTLLQLSTQEHNGITLENASKNYSKKGEQMCVQDGYVIIRNAEHLCGTLTKTQLGGSKKGIFYYLLRQHGPQLCADIMLRFAKLTTRYLQYQRGMSIGIEDVTPSDQVTLLKKDLIAKGYTEVNGFIEKFKSGELEAQPGFTVEETLEAVINGALSKIRETAGSMCVDELPWYNAPLTMAVCGSKGSTINISQMVACVGQQTINGGRIPNGYVTRSLPHFMHHSKSPQAKGFVENSFYTGLSPTEFVFHTCAGREGLVDTAVKTAETGYMQRRLIKGMEDLKVQYDYSVRNSDGNIMQFIYGDDSLDPCHMECNDSPCNFKNVLAEKRAALQAAPEDCLRSHEVMPIVMECLGKEFYGHGPSKRETRSMIAFFEEKKREEEEEEDLPEDIQHEKEVLLAQLVPITRKHVEEVSRVARRKFGQAKAEPGTSIGIVAAQSIGEPATQMTLRTFHFAGVASMSITLGVPRIKEIINGLENISTPIVTAPLVQYDSERSARIVKARIEKTTLGQVCEYMKEVYSPSMVALELRLDKDVLQALQLELTCEDVINAVIGNRRLKLKKEHVKTVSDSDGRIIVYPPAQTKDAMFFSLQQLKALLPYVIVVGLPTAARAVINIEDVPVRKDDGSLGNGSSTRREHVLAIEGTGLRDVMGVSGVRGEETVSNNVLEVASVLGIEAARVVIISEINKVMQSYGLDVDYRHVTLLSDTMTSRGVVHGVTRFGLQKMKDNVMFLASFEQTTEHLFNAAVYGKEDKMHGVSEQIIIGNPVSMGTGSFSLLRQPPTDNRGEYIPFRPKSRLGHVLFSHWREKFNPEVIKRKKEELTEERGRQWNGAIDYTITRLFSRIRKTGKGIRGRG
ncbi:DNA-directed RNA polymerase III subunit RPC1, partial [Aduncisulcus paluster]